MLLLTSIENWDGLVQEIFNKVIPAGEAEWKEGKSVGSHKIFDIGDIRITLGTFMLHIVNQNARDEYLYVKRMRVRQ